MISIGSKLQNFEVIREIGAGGMSEVYLVQDNLDRQFALKILSARLTGDDSFRDRFRHEAKIMASLNHPSIVGLHSYFEEQGNYCLAMEYMSSGSLKDLIKRSGPLPESQALAIFHQIAQALAHAHSQGVIHRDVKPSNILIGADGSYKLGDFGIARMKETEGLTRTGSRMGTLIYMSPEQIKDSKHVDAKTDVYSLGVLLYEMLTGKAPYNENDDSEYDIINMIVRQDLPDPRKFSPHLSKDTLEIFKRATRKDPERRPEARELLSKATEPANADIGPETRTVVKPSTGKQPHQPRKRGGWGIAALSLAILLLLATGIYATFKYLIVRKSPAAEAYVGPGTTVAAVARSEQSEKKASPAAKQAEGQSAENATKTQDNAPSIPLVYVAGGSFSMGSNENNDEQPVHQVRVSSFYIGKYEVTQAQWQQVMGSNPSYFKGDNLPVEQVSWYDAVDFCNRLSRSEGLTPCYSGSGASISCNFGADGYRLPTEAEWEFAARGGNGSQGYTYSGSNDLGSVAWYNGNSGSRTHNVGGRSSNELGLHDMSGNVWEWCWDWYGESYYQNSPAVNPRGPGSGSYRALRGGSWNYPDYCCRVAGRHGRGPDPGGGGDYGFRLTRAIP